MKDFKSLYIKANPNVEKKMKSMKLSSPYRFKKIYNRDKVFDEDEKELKLGYININGLFQKSSHTFINEDRNLLALDFLILADTRLMSNEKQETFLEASLSNWKILERYDSNDQVKHMGLLFLKSCESKKEDIVRNITKKMYYKWEEGKKITFMQVLTVSFLRYHLSSSFVYVSALSIFWSIWIIL